METLTLTPAVLAALAEGVQRLEDGDPNQVALAREVRNMMARDHQLVEEGYRWHPASLSTSGYVRPHTYAFQTADGRWCVQGYANLQELAPGQVLCFDPECTIPLRTL